MTLLIKGMKMPKNGDELLSIDIWPSGKVSINLDPMCKAVGIAVEIPTPHGRLGDLDDLKECIDYVTNDCTCPLHIAAELYQYMDHAPTIIEAEEG